MVKKIYFTILILFSTFLFIDVAYAQIQDNLYYEVNIDEIKSYINDESNIFYDNKSIKYYLEYFKDYIENNNSNNYNYSILYKSNYNNNVQNQQIIIVFHNGTNPIQVALEGLDGLSSFQISNFLMGGRVYVSFDVGTTSYENQWNNRLTALDNILKNNSTSNAWNNFNFYFPKTNLNNNISLSSNNNYFVPYYSSFENSLLYYLRSYSDSAYNRLLKYNNSIIDFNEYIQPLDVYINAPDEPEIPPTFTNNSFISKYNGVFLSNIPKNQIDNYQAEFTVGQVGEYIDFQYQPSFYGRINHGTYYTYEKINCSYIITSDEPYYEDFGIQKDFIRYDKKYFQFTSCTSDLTNYDNVYVSLHNLYYSQIFNFSSSANYGYISANDFLGNYVKVLDFYDLNKNSAYMLSLKNSNLNPSGTYFGSLNNQIFDLMYNKDSLSFSHISPGVPIDSKIFYIENIDSYYNNKNIMFDLSYSTLDNDTLLLVVDENSLVSYNSNYKENFQFTYYDNDENIVTNNFNVYEEDTSNNDYDLDNYFDVVRQFIDSLSSDINQFSEVLQNCYDLAPDFIQNIIFVLFILSMSYILFKLIGK